MQSTFISINKLSGFEKACECTWIYYKLVGRRWGHSGLNHGKGEEILYLLQSALCPTQTSIQWVLAALSLGTRQPGHEVDKLPPSNAKVKKEWSCTSTPACAFTVHMGNPYLQL